MLESVKYDVTCTWGDGPDILLSTEIMLGPEKGKRDFFDLTAEQARRLAQDLVIAADRVDELNASVEAYFAAEQEKGVKHEPIQDWEDGTTAV